MLTGMITGFLAAMLGWQINIVGIHRGLERGRSGPLLVGLGATIADITIILIAFAGAAPLLHHHHFWATAKWFGIATLLFTSFRILFHKAVFQDPNEKKTRGPARSFVMGFIIVGGNPAVYLLWIGVIGLIMAHFHMDFPSFQFRFLFAAGFFAGCMLWFSILSFFILDHIRQWGEERLHLISRFSAVLLLLAAGFLVFEKF